MTIPQLIAVAELCAEARSESLHDGAVSSRAAQMDKRAWVKFMADLAPKQSAPEPLEIEDADDPASIFYTPDIPE